MSAGAIRRIKDLVVHVQFDDEQPEIGEVLLPKSPDQGRLLVNSLAPGNIAICLNILEDRTLQKNMPVERTGKGLEVPVGDVTIGRIFDAMGRPLDGQPYEV